jgi:hypothetical protein
MNHASVLDAGRRETKGTELPLAPRNDVRWGFFDFDGAPKCAKDEESMLRSWRLLSSPDTQKESSLITPYSLLALIHGDGRISSSSKLIE